MRGYFTNIYKGNRYIINHYTWLNGYGTVCVHKLFINYIFFISAECINYFIVTNIRIGRGLLLTRLSEMYLCCTAEHNGELRIYVVTATGLGVAWQNAILWERDGVMQWNSKNNQNIKYLYHTYNVSELHFIQNFTKKLYPLCNRVTIEDR